MGQKKHKEKEKLPHMGTDVWHVENKPTADDSKVIRTAGGERLWPNPETRETDRIIKGAGLDHGPGTGRGPDNRPRLKGNSKSKRRKK